MIVIRITLISALPALGLPLLILHLYVKIRCKEASVGYLYNNDM
jgi:hypothetical protein